MAYVVARRDGRFEIRESAQTPNGPRARTLASFRVLNETVLGRAAQKARRPFERSAVVDSGRRAGAPADVSISRLRDDGRKAAFVAASRRMARSASLPVRQRSRTDPGDALTQLLDFADAVRASQPPRPAEPLRFPVLAHLGAHLRHSAVAAGRAAHSPEAPR